MKGWTRGKRLRAAALLALGLLFCGYMVTVQSGAGLLQALAGLALLGSAISLKAVRYKSADRELITASSAITAGTPQLLSTGRVGIPANDIAAAAQDEVELTGRFRCWGPASQAWAVGDVIGWDADGSPYNGTASSGCFTNAASAMDFTVGTCTEAKGATTERGIVEINKYDVLAHKIADPGDGEAIPVTVSGSVALVTATAETRTIAAPSFVGQMLLLTMATDGGDCVVTVATTVNQTGNNTLTFADAADTIILVGKRSGANVRWSVASNDGVALSTV